MGLSNVCAKYCDKLGDTPIIGAILKPREKIAVLRLSGIIADSGMRRNSISHARYEQLIDDAFDTYKLKAIALVINSPGGSPAQSTLIADQIRRLAEEKEIPVYTFIEDVAASGGYWLSLAGDEIYALPCSIVGSIGVISSGFGFQDLIARHGIERRVHTSGKDKGFLDPFQDEKPGDVKRLKALQNDIHEQFKDWVRKRREGRIKAEEKDIFEGQFWSAPQALEYGLIDGLGDAKTILKSRYGKDVKFKEFKAEKGVLSSLLGGSADRVSLPDTLAQTLEDKSIRSRYGL
tara:strand:- start:3404 stop:4276 length:873 start_codon:yes stop_codon:yes gene_type:complete